MLSCAEMTTPTSSKSRHVSHKASLFTESVIREMTREALKFGAVNLSQGFPDFSAPEDIKRRAMEAIDQDINQYAITWGSKDFRDAIASKTKSYLGIEIDPEREITVTCGSTEGMIAAMMATVDPGEEVIVFEPFYENYAPDAILSDAHPRYVPLRAPDWHFDRDELKATFNKKTKAIIAAIIPSVDPQVTVNSVSGSTSRFRYHFVLRAIASRKSRAPQVIAY